MTLSRFWWVLGFVWLGLAAYVCLRPGQDIPGSFMYGDKVAHALGHAALAIYFCGLVPRRGWYKIFGVLTLFGAGIEAAQYLMAVGREADRYDLIANAAGVAFGFTLAHFGLCRWPQWAAWMLGQRAVQ